MFKNIDENILWKTVPSNAVRQKDTETVQLYYNGQNRGQTERYLIALGRLINVYYTNIQTLYESRDPSKLDVDGLNRLLKEKALDFLVCTDTNKDLIIHILENYEAAQKIKGTHDFYRWIINKIFGWDVTDVHNTAESYLILNKYDSYLYSPEIDDYLLSILYDNESITSTNYTIYIRIEENDTDVESKKELLVELAKSWGVNLEFVYVT